MSTNKITNNGDWTLQMVANGTPEQITADIKTKLQEYKFDCFFNIQAGINYDYFLSNKLQAKDFDILKAQILEVCYQVANVNVVEITNFDFNQQKRTCNIQITVNNNTTLNINL